jgi:hypothetical protein
LELGDPGGWVGLGYVHYYGLGHMELNKTLALEYYRQAAAKGDAQVLQQSPDKRKRALVRAKETCNRAILTADVRGRRSSMWGRCCARARGHLGALRIR